MILKSYFGSLGLFLCKTDTFMQGLCFDVCVSEVHSLELSFSWDCYFKIQPCSSCLYNGSYWVNTCIELTSLCRDLIRVKMRKLIPWSMLLVVLCWLFMRKLFNCTSYFRRKLSRTFYGYVLHMLCIMLIKSLLWWNLTPEFALPNCLQPIFVRFVPTLPTSTCHPFHPLFLVLAPASDSLFLVRYLL